MNLKNKKLAATYKEWFKDIGKILSRVDRLVGEMRRKPDKVEIEEVFSGDFAVFLGWSWRYDKDAEFLGCTVDGTGFHVVRYGNAGDPEWEEDSTLFMPGQCGAVRRKIESYVKEMMRLAAKPSTK